MQFEYDDKGTTFYYFVLSFFAMILIPCTYYFWPDEVKKKISEEEEKRQCYCPPCCAKRDVMNRKEPRRKTMKKLTRAVLVVLWALLIAGAVKVAQFEKEYNEYNPYDVLKLEQGASSAEIKKQYRRLSLEMHPDRGGDPAEFMKVTKAYKALTNEEAKKNWDEYGNPDGPGATQFGIALPSWIVDKKNSMWVLGAYILAFIIILPIVVGTWWYRSIQYSADEVLMDTEQIYGYFFHRTPNMSVKRILMILGASFEFEKGHNNEVQERPSDNIELPQLMRELPHLNEQNKEVPLCYPYSVKARALIHAHLSRLALPPNTLLNDLELILKKCPYLLKEMMNVVSQLMVLGRSGRVAVPPRLATVENLIKVNQMMIQGVWDSKSSFLMLPHISQENLRHFNTKKRKIKTMRQFVGMPNDERRMLLRTLSDEQYQDIINACWSFPHIEFEVKIKVIDDEDSHLVTAGSIVTAKVAITRSSLGELFEDETVATINKDADKDADGEPDTETEKPTKPVWQKKFKKGKGPAKKPAKKQQPKKKKVEKVAEEKKEEETVEDEEKKTKKKKKSKPKAEGNGEEDDGNEADSEDDTQGVEDIDDEEGSDDDDENGSDEGSVSDGAADDNKDEWDELKDDELIQPDKLLEFKSKESHPVHCPYFPLEKHEYWWCYIVARKTNTLVTAPQLVTSLKEVEEVQLKFTAPEKVGTYHYQVWARSDSYIDFDVYKNFKVEVSEAKEFDPGEHWDYSSDEDGKEESGESVYETEEEDDAADDSES